MTSQLSAALKTVELLQRNQETRLTALESTKPTLQSVLKTNSNANQQSITNVNSITSNNLIVQSNIQSLNNGQLLGFNNVDTYKISNGIVRSNTTSNILSVPLSNNTTGMISGILISTYSNLEFEIYCKNINNSVSINASTYKGYTNASSLTFSHSGNNIIITFHNNQSSSQKFLIKYKVDSIGN